MALPRSLSLSSLIPLSVLLPSSRQPVIPVTPTSPVFVATLPNFLQILTNIATQQDYIVSPQLQYPDPEPQNAYVHQYFEEAVEHVPLANILVENFLLPIVVTPVTTVPSPTPPTPPHCILPLPILPKAELFPNLFTAPPCTTADHHLHQYQVIYKYGEKIWTPQDKYIG